MKKIKTLMPLGLLILALFASYSFRTGGDKEITAREVKDHIKYLASDELGGRFPGTIGDSLTQEYIIKHFRDCGLKPAGEDGFRQRFDFISEVRMAKNNSFSLASSGVKNVYQPDTDFRPMSFSSIGRTEGGVVFAGYGIKAPDLNYDDLSGLDLKNKIALIMKNSPGHESPHDNPFSNYERTRNKCKDLADAGAIGVIVFTAYDDEDELNGLRSGRGTDNVGIPVITVKRYIAEKLLEINGQNLKGIQDLIDSLKKPNSFALDNVTAEIEADLEFIKSNTSNVVGLVEGTDPTLKNEYVVIGAHMDHLGDGTKYGSISTRNDPVIHNGADDNASGTAGVLELAQKIASVKKGLKRSYLFVTFGAEEAGLVGSMFFTKTELFKTHKIVAMINMDMIGRISENKLVVNGSGTSSVWKNILDSLNKNYSFAISYVDEGFGRSDYSSFFAKDIPVLGFFTGLHKDYHTETDDWELIDSEGEARILKLVNETALSIDALKTAPDLIKTQATQKEQMTGFKVTVGIIPDYSSNAEGMQILGVKAGGPGEKAGLKAGDIVIKFGSYEIKNIYDYTDALSRFKKGDEVDIVVKRGTEELTLKVSFAK